MASTVAKSDYGTPFFLLFFFFFFLFPKVLFFFFSLYCFFLHRISQQHASLCGAPDMYCSRALFLPFFLLSFFFFFFVCCSPSRSKRSLFCFFFFFVNLFLSFYLRSVSWAPSSGSSSRFKATPQVQYSGVNGCGKGRGRSGELKKKSLTLFFFLFFELPRFFFFFALFWNVDTKHHMGAYFSFLFFFSELSFKLLFTISLFCTLLSLLLPLFFFFGYSNSNVNKRWYIHVYSLRRLQPVFYRNVVCKKKKSFFFF